MSDSVDLCLSCGKEHERKLWGSNCDCGSPDVVHIGKCGYCGNPIGYLIDDDYCGPEKLVCSDCISRALKGAS